MIKRYTFVKGDARGTYPDEWMKDRKGKVVMYEDHKKIVEELELKIVGLEARQQRDAITIKYLRDRTGGGGGRP